VDGSGSQGRQGRQGIQGTVGVGSTVDLTKIVGNTGIGYFDSTLGVVGGNRQGYLKSTNSVYIAANDLDLVSRGNITAYGGAYVPSDRKWKTNIKTIENALFKVRQLRGVMYDWTDEFLKDVPSVNKKTTGLIAQDVEKVLPEAVGRDDSGGLILSYDKMIGLVIQAVNELADQVDQIEKNIAK
jgi:hypothetical protein